MDCWYLFLNLKDEQLFFSSKGNFSQTSSQIIGGIYPLRASAPLIFVI